MLLRKCANQEPSEEEELEADKYTNHIEAYCPVGNPDSPSVNMSTAVALVNRYALGRDTSLLLLVLMCMSIIMRIYKRLKNLCSK